MTGTTSDGLADIVETVVRECRSRIIGTGREQYETDGEQRILAVPMAALVQDAIEEVDDLIVYAAVLRYRLDRIRALVTTAAQ